MKFNLLFLGRNKYFGPYRRLFAGLTWRRETLGLVFAMLSKLLIWDVPPFTKASSIGIRLGDTITPIKDCQLV